MSKRPSVAELSKSISACDEATLAELAEDPRAGVRRLVSREEKRREKLLAEAARLRRMLRHEEELWANGQQVAGVDEVGVGPLAGPVMAAAVILPPGTSIEGINDSKQLDRSAREELAEKIQERAVAFAVGSCDREEIDRLNIYQAAREAMRRAVSQLSPVPDALLVDARTVPGLAIAQRPIIKGDSQSQSIAAASIVAKVARDQWMRKAATRFPDYGFESHKGYYCPQHLEALSRLGPCELHRRSFSPVAALCSEAELQALSGVREQTHAARAPEQTELF
ncbi:MAG: ribonuclease HII [Myxococcota bacterium]